MMNKLIAFLTIVGIFMGAMLLYANAAYFPMDRGIQVEEKVKALQEQTNAKLDLILKKVDK